jgi:hypothetical protein
LKWLQRFKPLPDVDARHDDDDNDNDHFDAGAFDKRGWTTHAIVTEVISWASLVGGAGCLAVGVPFGFFLGALGLDGLLLNHSS